VKHASASGHNALQKFVFGHLLAAMNAALVDDNRFPVKSSYSQPDGRPYCHWNGGRACRRCSQPDQPLALCLQSPEPF
jgi:hypothetical protein